jgi:D-3-phosphoglycerate dehydrogenase
MLAVAKRIPDADRAVRAGNFEFKYAAPLTELYGKTLGIVGWGRIGRRTAELARAAFDLKVEVYSPSADPDDLAARGMRTCDSLAELLRRADIVSLHVPLNDRTRGMIGAAELSRMKPSAILINTGRGAVIDEDALIRLLRERRFAGAGLDVFRSEKMAADYELLRLDNVVLSPHIAGSTAEGLERTAVAVVELVLDVLRGHRPAHLVNPAVWDRRRVGAHSSGPGDSSVVAR